MGAVIEAFGRVNHDDLAVEGDAAQGGRTGGFRELELLDVENGAEDLVGKGDVLEAIVAEDAADLPLEGGTPGGVRTGSGGKQESAVFEVFFEVFTFLGGQVEVGLAGHDDKRDLEKFLIGEFDRLETALGGNRGLLLHGGQEFIAEALGCAGAGIDQVAAFDGTFLGCERQDERE